jgi:hypothetical protein
MSFMIEELVDDISYPDGNSVGQSRTKGRFSQIPLRGHQPKSRGEQQERYVSRKSTRANPFSSILDRRHLE